MARADGDLFRAVLDPVIQHGIAGSSRAAWTKQVVRFSFPSRSAAGGSSSLTDHLHDPMDTVRDGAGSGKEDHENERERTNDGLISESDPAQS